MIHTIMKVFNFFNSSDKLNSFSAKYKLNFDFLDKQLKYNYKGKRVLAVYDFADSPYTADIVFFILNAEIQRRKNNLQKVDILFITNDKYPCNPTYQVVDNHKQLIYNFAIEFTRLFYFIGSVTIADNRHQAGDILKATGRNYLIFPKDYNIKYPFERLTDLKTATYYVTNYAQYARADSSLNCINPPEEQLRFARKWLLKYAYPKIPIVITLRETAKVQVPRNSNIEAWQKLVDYFSTQGRYLFVVVRDYYTTYDENPIIGDNVVYCNEASLSLSFRTALYQLATLNLFVPTGPSVVCLVSNKIRYIEFKVVTDDPCAVPIEHYKTYYGFEKGDNWYSATKYQKLVWEDDGFDVLKRETDKMLKLLENDGKLYPDFYDSEYKQCSNEEIQINKEIYNQESIISQRTPLKYYVFAFKFLKFVKKFFKFNYYKSIDEIKVKQNDKIVLYGAGIISQELIKKYKQNIVAVIDKNFYNLQNKELNGIKVYPAESLNDLYYNYLIVTPRLREYGIIEELKEKFDIKNKYFLIATKYD